MAVEIRELKIKGTVTGGNQIEKKFDQVNSPLLNSRFISQLKREIIEECTEKIFDKLERQKHR